MGNRIPDANIPPKSRFVRLYEVAHRTGLSRTTIYDEMSKGTFPRNYSLASRRVGWLESDIDDWIRKRLEGGGH